MLKALLKDFKRDLQSGKHARKSLISDLQLLHAHHLQVEGVLVPVAVFEGRPTNADHPLTQKANSWRAYFVQELEDVAHGPDC